MGTIFCCYLPLAALDLAFFESDLLEVFCSAMMKKEIEEFHFLFGGTYSFRGAHNTKLFPAIGAHIYFGGHIIQKSFSAIGAHIYFGGT